jgi:nucleotide-binding universal stress UspA family protein
MRQLKHIMVCLDLTEMDELLIQYTAFFCGVVHEIEKVYFVHNIRFDNVEDAQKIISKLDKPLDEIVTETIEEKIETFFKNALSNTQYEIIVEEDGSTPGTLARLAKIHDVNLTIVGKKISYPGSGLAAEKLLRMPHSNSSLLLIPETAYHSIHKILVPTDFSKPSTNAIEAGAYLKKINNAELSCQNVFSVQSFYFPTMMVQDLKPVLKDGAKKRWEKFAKTLTSIEEDNIECTLSFNSNKNIAQTIYDHAVRTNTDLIIVSSKGKGGFAAFMVGSVAMQLVQADLHIPLWVVRSSEKS